MPCRGSPSPPLLSLPLLIISLPIIAFLLLFFVVPSFLSLTTHKTKQAHTVKSSWDSLNILLVLFAILCGVFARRNDDESSTTNEDAANTNVYHHGTASHVVHNKVEQHAVSDTRWSVDQFSSDQKIYGPNNSPFGTPAAVTGRLKRNSSSYPDLRQESFWETGDDRFRFFDDFEINKYRRSPIYHGRNRSDDSNVKEIPIDTFVLSSSPLSPSPPPPPKSSAPPPPPPPQTTTSNHRPKRTYRTVAQKIEKVSEKDHEFTETKNPPPTPPPPPPPPPRLAPPTPSEKKKIERKKSNATKEIKMVLASLYRKRKKKQKTRILPDETPHSSTEPPSFTTPPPPPPPPPPLPSMFQSLFRKGGSKSKRIHSFSTSVPPTPPPPPPPLRRSCKHKNQMAPPPPPPAPSTPPPEPPTRRKSTSTGRPPLPTRFNNFQDENFNSGGQSPLIPMPPPPPPPPPPPFKVPGFQFVLRGDFVKVRSAQSSRCGSPELRDIDGESHEAVKAMDDRDGIGGGSGFCPSPDVNIKADTFIARLRDEWRLEKINSFREKGDVGRGPGLGPIKF